MGWEDCHLHQFIVRGEYYGPLDHEDREWEMGKGDEEGVSTSQVAKRGRKVRFIYEYDFGDSWQHEILLERILEPEPNVAYPRCITRGAVCSGDDHLAVTEDEGECCECRPTTTPSPGSTSGR